MISHGRRLKEYWINADAIEAYGEMFLIQYLLHKLPKTASLRELFMPTHMDGKILVFSDPSWDELEYNHPIPQEDIFNFLKLRCICDMEYTGRKLHKEGCPHK